MSHASDDQWIPTTCYMCYTCCGIKAHRVNGVVVELKGNEEHPHNLGKICAKGRAGIMGLYDPYRINAPLRRTNPEKGIGVDPKWEEISWDEALDLVSEKLKKIRKEDPRKLVLAGLDFNASLFTLAFCSAFGTPNRWVGPAGYFCGNVLHPVHYLVEGAFFAEFDIPHCNYCLLIGSEKGFMVNLSAVILSRKMADARERGMKVVAVNPVCLAAGSKADEWVPIRPGTDGALALSLLNVLINDLGIYDAEFLKKYTNGPYLVGPDGQYVRDRESHKPLVWDSTNGQAVPYDAGNNECLALEGTFQIQGADCRPAFQALKEHVKKYEPEKVAEITSVPSSTIRRLAQEFGQAARIGSTIIIDGKELPHRPVAVAWTRGAAAHKHGMMAGYAIHLLNMIVGAIDVPGGILGNRSVTPFYTPQVGPDGFLLPGATGVMGQPYPAREIKRPEAMDLAELFPIAGSVDPLFEEGMLDPEKYGLPYRPELVLHLNSNLMMTTSGPARMAQVLKAAPFMVSFSLYLDETAQFADLVLPDVHYLERLVPFPNHNSPQGLTVGAAPWYFGLEQPVVNASGQGRAWAEVLLALADRTGFFPDLAMALNTVYRLKEPYRLDPGKIYSLEEFADLWAKSWFGPQHDLAWFKEQGVFIVSKKVEEAYPRPFTTGRIPIYLEYLIQAGQELKEVTDHMGLAWDVSDYQPLPDWKPCPAFLQNGEGYDLWAVNFKVPFHTFSLSAQNPWLNDLSEHHPYVYKILINTETAGRKGIKDGDSLWLESLAGKIKGTAKLTECIHPEVLGLAGVFGHWAETMPIAKGKGAHFNTLLPSGLERIDMVSAALDSCVRVKVHKASA